MALIAYLMESKANYGPHLIIVPNAVAVNWKSELERWLPDAKTIHYTGSKPERKRMWTQVGGRGEGGRGSGCVGKGMGVGRRRRRGSGPAGKGREVGAGEAGRGGLPEGALIARKGSGWYCEVIWQYRWCHLLRWVPHALRLVLPRNVRSLCVLAAAPPSLVCTHHRTNHILTPCILLLPLPTSPPFLPPPPSLVPLG
jgi:hypothetical protein